MKEKGERKKGNFGPKRIAPLSDLLAIKPNIINSKARIAIVASRFNDFITKRLLEACLAELRRQGMGDDQLIVFWVPGAFEIPLVALKFAGKKEIDAVICLGAVIRGETYHFELVSNECARGIMDVSLRTNKPVIMGVLTTDTVGQAQARAGVKNNKGLDAAAAVLEMIALLKEI